ncbi:hypothetical protein LC593_10740 [Nostoc sp. CHAB 5844]|nr:hypothetical protein [Nostoc sp. CHAB 5844]
MTKLLPIEENGQTVGYFFDCPGCQGGHAVHISPHKNGIGASWTFNGDMEKPTFSPSILSRYTFTNQPMQVCHSFVVDGKIQFLNDCTHSLAGQIVDIPDL